MRCYEQLTLLFQAHSFKVTELVETFHVQNLILKLNLLELKLLHK